MWLAPCGCPVSSLATPTLGLSPPACSVSPLLLQPEPSSNLAPDTPGPQLSPLTSESSSGLLGSKPCQNPGLPRGSPYPSSPFGSHAACALSAFGDGCRFPVLVPLTVPLCLCLGEGQLPWMSWADTWGCQFVIRERLGGSFCTLYLLFQWK